MNVKITILAMRDITSLDDLTVNNVGMLRKINELCLPARYSDEWYQEALNSDQIVTLAYYSELPVGGVKARPISLLGDTTSFEAVVGAKLAPKMVPNAVYIESLAVLKAYRSLGIGKKLLKYVVDQTKDKFIHVIYVHVHIDNTESVEWYKKQGFTEKETIKDYYKSQGLENPDAMVLSLEV